MPAFLSPTAPITSRRVPLTPLPKRPRCDPPDFQSIVARQSNLKDAWQEYLKSAARPYSLNSFKHSFWRWCEEQNGADLGDDSESTPFNPTGDEFIASKQYWRARSLPKTKVIALRNAASVRVINGALELTERLPLHLSPDGQPSTTIFNDDESRRGKHSAGAPSMPRAIILPEHGWHLTAEALKFCISHNIALASVSGRTAQGEKGLISIAAGNPVSDAALLRAQVRGKVVNIAREIVRQKIETCASIDGLSRRDAREYIQLLEKAQGLKRIVYVEAQAAYAYWNSRQCEVKSSSRRWPANWARFSIRNSSIGRRGARHAAHPVNALLNWAYAVVAGRLSAELFARGAQLAIGFLHIDKPGRYSLAYDALELLRPLVDEKVFAFVAKTRFRMGDFLVAPSGKNKGEVRVAPELLKVFAPAVFLPNEEIAKAADWMVETIVGSL
jgi:CRISP-associated protein Cas1